MKNVLITGAAGNLGQAVVEKFMKEGFKVLATVDTKEEHHLDAGIQTYAVDLMNESHVNETIAKVISENKTIDAALLLVGGYAGGNIDETDGTTLRKMMSLNFETAYFVARPVFQQMVKQGGGRIIFVASKTALVAEQGKNNVAYALSKFLLTKLAELLNAEGASKNVVCSVVAPSVIDTGTNRKSMPKADFSKWVKPEDIAESMYFLASEQGSILRDPILKVYGGS
ncbi:MAG TPA: SDR family NAD(P)-dependent oxidoreductase [Cyclobacteriaceae bacterium]|nr:SDR family NAD(P)-dependent oxidoreductase [Cyclobacteriaceae bacterium]